MLRYVAELRRKHGLRRGLSRQLRRWIDRCLRPSTEASVERQLRELGVRRGDLVLIHSAFSKIGYLKGGPQALLNALWNILCEEGTIVMPSFPFNDPALEYAARGPVFDVRHTPAQVGQLQEYFRLQPGTLRSLHPTHPYCASGHLAAELVAGHHLQINPFTRGTPLYRFVGFGGKTLLIGVGLKNCSPFRVIEEKESYPYPVFHPQTLHLPVRDENGREFLVETLVHSGELAPHRRTEVFRPHLVARGLLREGMVGKADAILIECGSMLAFLEEMLDQGITPYAHLGSDFLDSLKSPGGMST